MSIELKIKSKHLAEEARIIRFEERRLKAQRRTELLNKIRNHRVHEVRNENRATFLARAYLRGQSYCALEAKILDQTKFDCLVYPRVLAMINKYGTKTTEADLDRWLLTNR